MKRKYLRYPIANLRREKVPFEGKWKDPLQETQVLFGDPVDVIKEEGEWSYVQLPLQQKFDAQNELWMGYPGWIESRLLGIDPICDIFQNGKINSETLIKDARKFLGTPYLWGGASLYDPVIPKATGVDCSGLVCLLHKRQGVFLPRNAHDQWLKSAQIKGCELQAGDLVFIELKEKPGRMDHVMLYAGENCLIEAVIDPGIVREISVKERLGTELEMCRDAIYETAVYRFSFGRVY